jgi:hypothetical protein
VNEVLLNNERYHVGKLRSFAKHHTPLRFWWSCQKDCILHNSYSKNVKLINSFVGSVTTINIHKALINLCFGKLRSNNLSTRWPSGIRRWSLAARLLRLWVRIPPEAWMFVCCECCVLLSRGLCDGLIALSEESYRVWCVVVCDLETSWMRRPWSTGGCCTKTNKQNVKISSGINISEV